MAGGNAVAAWVARVDRAAVRNGLRDKDKTHLRDLVSLGRVDASGISVAERHFEQLGGEAHDVGDGGWSAFVACPLARFRLPRLPEDVPMGDAMRLKGLAGVAGILPLCWAISENRRAISPRTVIGGLVLQVGLGVALLQSGAGRSVLDAVGSGVGDRFESIEFLPHPVQRHDSGCLEIGRGSRAYDPAVHDRESERIEQSQLPAVEVARCHF